MRYYFKEKFVSANRTHFREGLWYGYTPDVDEAIAAGIAVDEAQYAVGLEHAAELEIQKEKEKQKREERQKKRIQARHRITVLEKELDNLRQKALQANEFDRTQIEFRIAQFELEYQECRDFLADEEQVKPAEVE